MPDKKQEIQRYKCHTCYSIVDSVPCSVCGERQIDEMCSEDHICTCTEDVHDGIRYCKKCGEIVCPCGSHDTVGLSRITGYIAEVGGFSAGKAQELKDRHRYNIGVDE